MLANVSRELAAVVRVERTTRTRYNWDMTSYPSAAPATGDTHPRDRDLRDPLIGPLRPFTSTIFTEMTALATRTGAVNLGQGFPDEDGPAAMLEAARRAISAGINQYPPGAGNPELREAIAAARLRDYGQQFDPTCNILVTAGATEAIAAAVLALTQAGDEIIMLEPYYDSYPVVAALSGATAVPVPLLQDSSGRFTLDPERLAHAITPRTRMLLINTPHNPTGTVLSPAELQQIADLAQAHNLIVVTDEVYEYLVYDEAKHVPIGTLPGMAERTVTISSAGKTFNVTGWKVGWACGPTPLIRALQTAKQFLTFSGGAPFQPAVADALRSEMPWVEQLRSSLQDKRNRLVAGLRGAGLGVTVPAGTYFVQADIRDLTGDDGLAFCHTLPERVGVAAVPTQVFYRHQPDGAHLVRFAFCKKYEVLDEAVRRLARNT